MARKRKFEQLTEKQQILSLFKGISMAVSESDKKKWRTDLYGIAKQYLAHTRVRKEDFDKIKSMTIDEIVKKIMEE